MARIKCFFEVLRRPSILHYFNGVRFDCSSSTSLHFSISELTELLQQELGDLDQSSQDLQRPHKDWYELRQDAAAVLGSLNSDKVAEAAGANRILKSSSLCKNRIEADSSTVTALLSKNEGCDLDSHKSPLPRVEEDTTDAGVTVQCTTEEIMLPHLLETCMHTRPLNHDARGISMDSKKSSSLKGIESEIAEVSNHTVCWDGVQHVVRICEDTAGQPRGHGGTFTGMDLGMMENGDRMLECRMQDIHSPYLPEGKEAVPSFNQKKRNAPSAVSCGDIANYTAKPTSTISDSIPLEKDQDMPEISKPMEHGMPLSVVHGNDKAQLEPQVIIQSNVEERIQDTTLLGKCSVECINFSIDKDGPEGLSNPLFIGAKSGEVMTFHVKKFETQDRQTVDCSVQQCNANCLTNGNVADTEEHSLQHITSPMVNDYTTVAAHLLIHEDRSRDLSQPLTVGDGSIHTKSLSHAERTEMEDSNFHDANNMVNEGRMDANLSTEETFARHATLEKNGSRKLSHDEVVRLLLDGLRTYSWVRLLRDIKRHNILVTPAEVTRVLRMVKNTVKAWDFFKWVSSLPGYAHDIAAYAIMLDLLGRASEFARLEELLVEMDQMHIAHTTNTINILIGTFVTGEQIHMAERWFCKLHELGLKPTTYTYSCLLQGYSKAGNWSKALEKYEAVSEKGLPLDPISYNVLLDGLSKNSQVDAVLNIFETMRHNGNIADVYSYTIVVRTLAKAGRIEEAFELFEDMSASGTEPNKFTYNALLGALVHREDLEDSIKLFQKMLNNGVEPDFSTFQHIVKLLCKKSQFHKMSEVIDALEEDSVKEEAYESFVKVLGRMGYLNEAFTLLEKLKGEGLNPSKMLLVSLIGNLCRAGDPNQALVLMDEMDQRGYKSDSTLCNSIISALRNKNKLRAAYSLFKRMKDKGPAPNIVTYNILIAAATKSEKLGLAEALFNEMEKSGCTPNIITYNSLIHNFARAGSVKAVQKLLYAMESKGITHDVVTYNHMIECYGRADKPDKALEVFHKMKEEGCSPSCVTYNIVLSSLANANRPDSVLLYYEQMKEEGFVPDAMTFTILSRMYDSCSYLNKQHLMAEIKKAGLTYAMPTL